MPPFRNFLGRKQQLNAGNGEDSVDENFLSPNQDPASIPIRKSHDEPAEYKLSVVSDSGVYLPPSPPEKPSFWHRYPGSKKPPNHRDLVDANEPFSISRESFDSYRRSFDISARSPVIHPESGPSRTSLDSRCSRLTPSATHSTSFTKPDPMEEETFEDVGLGEEVKPKKKGFLSRFGDSSNDTQSAKSSTSPFGFHIPGRKRGQSGAGSELGSMKVPPSVTTADNQQ